MARDSLDSVADHKTALAAVRVLGPDLFVPQVLTGAPCHPDDVTAATASFRVFPSTRADVPVEAVPAWRD